MMPEPARGNRFVTTCLVAATVLSCTATRVSVREGRCEVWTTEEVEGQLAREIGRRCDRISTCVQELLGLPPEGHVFVEILDLPYVENRPGTLGAVWVGSPTRIMLGTASLADLDVLDLVLAHELVHLYVAKNFPQTHLPYEVEEGLAIQVASLVFPEISWLYIGPSERDDIEMTPAMLDVTLDESQSLDTLERLRFERAARELVRRIGHERLIRKLQAGQVTREFLLAEMR